MTFYLLKILIFIFYDFFYTLVLIASQLQQCPVKLNAVPKIKNASWNFLNVSCAIIDILLDWIYVDILWIIT